MFSVTSSIFAGSPEDLTFFPFLYPTMSVEQALEEIHAGHDVLMVEDDWLNDAQRILLGLGATPDWARDVVDRAVEFRRIKA